MSAETLLSRLEKVRRLGPGRWHRDLPSIDYLRECFDLDETSGRLTWKIRPHSHFASAPSWGRWNKRYAGCCADVDGGGGYFLVCINAKRYKAHRVVFAMHYGVDPGPLLIDHIDGNRSNNAPSNLRLAENWQNVASTKGLRSDNKSGHRGVKWNARNRKWEVKVTCRGNSVYLGLHESLVEAAEVARKAREGMFGEFAP